MNEKKLIEEILVQLTLIEMGEVEHENSYDVIGRLLKGLHFMVI